MSTGSPAHRSAPARDEHRRPAGANTSTPAARWVGLASADRLGPSITRTSPAPQVVDAEHDLPATPDQRYRADRPAAIHTGTPAAWRAVRTEHRLPDRRAALSTSARVSSSKGGPR